MNISKYWIKQLKNYAFTLAKINPHIPSGVQQGDEVSVHYDPMIAKLVVWDNDRISALDKLSRKLSEYKVVGLNTNLQFLRRLTVQPQFVEGQVHTGFIEEHTDSLLSEQPLPNSALVQAVVGIVLHDELLALSAASRSDDPFNPFATLTAFRVNHLYERVVELFHNKKEYKVRVLHKSKGVYSVNVGVGETDDTEVSAHLTRIVDGGLQLTAEINNQTLVTSSLVMPDSYTVHLFTSDGSYEFSLPDYSALAGGLSEAQESLVTSPMPGVIDKVMVQAGDSVRAGDPLLVVIAMKMEHVIKSPKDGIVKRILFQAGENVSKNIPLVQWKEE